MSKKSKKARAKNQEAPPTEAMRKVIQNAVNEVRRQVAVSRPPAELAPNAINFNPIPDYSDLVMESIFKNVADKCHSQAKELAPNGINFVPYEEVKGPPPPHVNQRCTMTPMENKMSEIKTVTHEGKVYQIDQDYLFSVRGTTWVYEKLTGIDYSDSKPFCTASNEWLYIKEVPASENMGTITPAPIELVNGAAYMFDPHNTKLLDVIGLYEKNNNQFYFNGRHVVLAHCSNIRLMTVESK